MSAPYLVFQWKYDLCNIILPCFNVENHFNRLARCCIFPQNRPLARNEILSPFGDTWENNRDCQRKWEFEDTDSQRV